MFNHPPRTLQEALQTAFLRPQGAPAQADADAITHANASADAGREATPAPTGSRHEPAASHTGGHGDFQSARSEGEGAARAAHAPH